MSGIRTLSDLRDRCRVDDETGCWLWGGAISCGVPRVWIFDPEADAFRTMTGARASWILAGGGAIRGKTVYHARCTAALCVNRAHLELGTKAEAGAHLKASGHLRGDPRRAIINKRNGRRLSQYTPELRALILSSDEPATHLGPKLGIAHSTVSLIRQHKRWAEGVAGSSVFSQMRAAA